MASEFPTAFLRRIGPSEDHKLIPLDRNEVSIGRSKENSYTIVDLVVSRRHVVFRLKKDQWMVESLGMNGVAVNQLNLSKNQPVVIQHMDTIEFGGSKFMYMFRLLSSESGDEPLAKKMRIPLADRNYPSLRDSPELYNNWMRSKKSLEKTLVEESDNLDVKLEQHKILKDSIITEQKKLTEQFENAKAQLEIKFANEKKEFEEKVARGMIEKSELQKEKEILEERMTKAFEEFQMANAQKAKEFDEQILRINLEKEEIIRQKEIIVEQVTREKKILQEKMEEESRLREEMTNELAEIKKSHSKELEELHRKMEEEVKNNQLKGSENESRISQMQQELARKEKEIADLQNRYTIGLETYYQAIQSFQEQSNCVSDFIVLDDGDEQPTSSKMTKEEKDTQEKQIFGMHQAHSDFVARLENTLENELQCGICSELIVFATSLDCMHTFCQYCINQWKKNKVPIECPICRTPITLERRNFIVDNAIDAIVASLSEEMKNARKTVVEQRLALANQVGQVSETKPIPRSQPALNTATRQVQAVVARSRGRRRGPGSVPEAQPAPPAPRTLAPTPRAIAPAPRMSVAPALRTTAPVSRLSAAPRMAVVVGTHISVGAPAAPPVSVRVAVNQRQFRPIAPASATLSVPAFQSAGSSSTAMDEEVIILSESEPTSEATFGDQSIVEVVTIRSSLRRRRVTLPCPTCGRRKRVDTTCRGCGV